MKELINTFLISVRFNLDHFFITLFVAQCEYANKTYNIDQSFITLDCNQSCVCDFVNGTARPSCSSLCTTPSRRPCLPESQEESIVQQTIGTSTCSCPVKICVPG